MTPTAKTMDGLHDCRSHVEPHEHAVFVYDDMEDILTPLEQFIRDGNSVGDLSVFVHSFEGAQEARGFLSRRLRNLIEEEEAGAFTSAPYRDAFERSGRIDHDHVGGIVSMLQTSAKTSGRRSPRIFVDASKNYIDAGRADEWFEFERWLGPRLQADVGLVCAYRAQDLRDPKILQRVLETHQYRFDTQRP